MRSRLKLLGAGASIPALAPLTYHARMNTNANPGKQPRPAIPAGLAALWHEACDWVRWLFGECDRDTLQTHGVSRRQGAKLGVWLMQIEGALRRLILAAALSFALPASRKLQARALAHTQHTAFARRPGFSVFRLASSGAAHGPASGDTPPAIPTQLGRPPPTQSKPYGHIPFPVDPLLSLGFFPPRSHTAPPSAGPHRARNPLDRWVRPTRQDPDWRPPIADTTLMFGAPEKPRPSSTRTHSPRTQRPPHDPDALPASLSDWRRCYDEWERVLPAPYLAARFDALAHLIAHPHAAIARTARRLRMAPAPILPLARNASTIPDPPRRASRVAAPDHLAGIVRRACATLLNPDTS